MGKPDALFRRSWQGKSAMYIKFFEEGQLFDLGEDENDTEEKAEHKELNGRNVIKWDKRNGLWLVSEEHRLEVLRQHHNSRVAGQ